MPYADRKRAFWNAETTGAESGLGQEPFLSPIVGTNRAFEIDLVSSSYLLLRQVRPKREVHSETSFLVMKQIREPSQVKIASDGQNSTADRNRVILL